MKVLIVFATYSQGTRLASEIIKDTLEKDGHDVTLQNIFDVDVSGNFYLNKEHLLQEIARNDVIIFGSCTWFENKKEGQPHSGFLALVEHAKEIPFQKKRFAVFALGDASQYAVHFCGAAGHLEKFVIENGGRLMVPPLRVDRFYFNQEKNTELIRKWAGELSSRVKGQQNLLQM